jgi:oxygen-independent coproporphyrinogen-3 oxidase
MQPLPPLSLYLHFPWCVSKCPYCDFNSHSLKGDLPAAAYVDALLTDLNSVLADVGNRPVVSVFLGGGTPSLFPPEELYRLLSAVADRLNLAMDAEITMEANPGAVEHAAFGDYRAAGINRLSLGVQSFADDKLKRLGRIHNAADVREAFVQARTAGFKNINLDLMYALPAQTLAEALADVRAATELGPEHISLYHLTLEPNTVFHARPPALPDMDLAWEMQAVCADHLQDSGYGNYEVSAWSQPGHACRHNLNYWQFGDYLGLGAGAHAKLTYASGDVRRTVRAAHPRAYLAQVHDSNPQVTCTLVTKPDLSFEFMLNVLRLRDGFSLELFEQRTGLEASSVYSALAEARERGLIAPTPAADEGDQIWLTEQGWRFLDDLQAIFLPTV